MKYIVAALVALSFVGVAVPASAQSSDPACWHAFKKNKPQCAQKSGPEYGGETSVHEAASGKPSKAGAARSTNSQ